MFHTVYEGFTFIEIIIFNNQHSYFISKQVPCKFFCQDNLKWYINLLQRKLNLSFGVHFMVFAFYINIMFHFLFNCKTRCWILLWHFYCTSTNEISTMVLFKIQVLKKNSQRLILYFYLNLNKQYIYKRYN